MKIILVIIVFLLVGCSSGELKTVDELYDKTEVVQETISSEVTVHTIVGKKQGTVISMDEKNKWVEVDLSVVSQHPMALVEASNGKVYKGELVGFDEKLNKGYLRVKSSLPLSEPIDSVDVDSFVQQLTYEDRLALKENFAEIKGQPSDKITEYEEMLFTQNRDEIEQFVTQFEASNDKSSFIVNDLLLAAIEEANASDIRYKLEQVEAVTIAKTGITVIGDIVFMDAEGSETSGQITYTVTKVDGKYKIINILLSE